MIHLLALALSSTIAASDAEVRVVEYLRANVTPGERVVVSQLVNEVFTAPEEREVLNRLFGTFFKIPLYIAQYHQSEGRPPTLEELSEQFRFGVPGEADVLLRIMESDPRMPRFFERDPGSGEIVRVDVTAITAHPKFGSALERTLGGWVGQPIPAFSLTGPEGATVSAESLLGQPYLLYFWFSGCPPCVLTAPRLAELDGRHASDDLVIVGVNADQVLEVEVTDDERRAYARKVGMNFPLVHLTPVAHEAFGSVGIFPTIFAVDRTGRIARHLVNAPSLEILEEAAQAILK